MTQTIALAGKGGTGKTTIAALIVKHLIETRRGTILAIDADPSSNLNLALGLPLTRTVGDIREDMLAGVDKTVGKSIARRDYLDAEIRYALEEGDEVDLLAMGRPEGQGCYCAVNHLLREIVDGLNRAYDYVVIDNEAGMEHLSRRTTRDVDVLLVVTDPTVRGILAAKSIIQLAHDLKINVKRSLLVVNRANGSIPPAVQTEIDKSSIELAGVVPADPLINAFDAEGKPIVALDGTSPAAAAVGRLARAILN